MFEIAMMLVTALVFIFILSVLVLIHEAGHFFVAKKFGIKVEEFGWGFPPRAFGIKKGETIYSINWLPIGGFVKLYGEDEAGMGSVKIKDQKSKIKNDLNRTYFSKPAWQRALVVFAGVVMNTILAFVIFYIFMAISNFKTSLPLLTDYKFTNVNQTNYNAENIDLVVNYIAPNSPAAQAQIDTPAKIVAVDGQAITAGEDFITYINDNKGKEIQITWEELETGKRVTKGITPRTNPPKNEGALGVVFRPMAFLTYDTPTQKALSGISYSYDLLKYSFVFMGELISYSFETGDARPVGESVSGPVGIFAVVSELLKIDDVKDRILNLLNLMGALSISLAFFNVLPIPALDGGRLFFIVIEMVTGKKVNEKYEAMAHAIGLTILLGLIVLITIFDISKYFR